MRGPLSQDWDKPEHIPDPDAKKPEDWDEEMDGEWEPPVIQNPEYKVRGGRGRRSPPQGRGLPRPLTLCTRLPTGRVEATAD